MYDQVGYFHKKSSKLGMKPPQLLSFMLTISISLENCSRGSPNRLFSQLKGGRFSSSHYSSYDRGSECARPFDNLLNSKIPSSSSALPKIITSSQKSFVEPTSSTKGRQVSSKDAQNLVQNQISIFPCLFSRFRKGIGQSRLPYLILSIIFGFNLREKQQDYDSSIILSTKETQSSVQVFLREAQPICILLISLADILEVYPAYL